MESIQNVKKCYIILQKNINFRSRQWRRCQTISICLLTSKDKRKKKKAREEAYLKLYDGPDWKCFCVRLNHADMKYLRKNWSGKKTSAPILEKRHHKYLGINTDAVCTIMRADGTVLGRRFIDHPSEKDRMYRTLGRIRKLQREHGSVQSRGKWAYTKRLNIELGKKIAGAIVRYAEENHADVIVFEYLEMQGRKLSGKKKNRNCICGENGISRNAVNIRHTEKGYSSRQEKDITVICQHRIISGQDNFIRELLKPLPATERTFASGKAPSGNGKGFTGGKSPSVKRRIHVYMRT